jgi:hypothetical protein
MAITFLLFIDLNLKSYYYYISGPSKLVVVLSHLTVVPGLVGTRIF